MTNADGVFDVLRGGAGAEDVTGEVGWVFGAIFGDKGTELTFVADKGALFVDDTTKVGKDGGTGTASAFGGGGWFWGGGGGVIHGDGDWGWDGEMYGRERIGESGWGREGR